VLVAGIGNIFHGDDAFGVEVAGRLLRRALPAAARVVDFGIRGFDLAYALLDGYDATILVDTTSRGLPPGTLYTIEIDGNDPAGLDAPRMDVATHGMDPVRVLRMAQAMGGSIGRILLVGCEPETFGPEEEGLMGLSAPVAAAVDKAADLVEVLVRRILEEGRGGPGAGAAAGREERQGIAKEN
jgi:hydrogenase maturation protease